MSAFIEHQEVPLLIAVVGHRDPQPEFVPQIISQFNSTIEYLEKHLPSTPLWLMTGLAVGADQIAAAEFLKFKRSKPNDSRQQHQLISVLPKTSHSYLEDFCTDADKIAYQNLLSKSDIIVTPDNNDLFRANQEIDLPSPDCYVRQSAFILRHCYVLIAFNNGVDNHERGGTAQSVAIQRGKLHPTFQNVDEVIATREPGALIEIDTPRLKNEYSGITRQPITYWLENKQKQTIGKLIGIPKCIDDVNYMLKNSDIKPQSWHARDCSLWRILDNRASRYKAIYISRTNWLLVLGFFISLSLADPPWQTLGLLGLAFAAWQYPNLQQICKQNFITGRAIAETVAVQEFWSEFQVKIDATDLLRLNLDHDTNWIRTLLRTLKLTDSICIDTGTFFDQNIVGNFSRWLDGQIDYLSSNTRKLDRFHRNFIVALIVIFIITITGATVDYFMPDGIFKWLFELGLGSAVVVVGFYELRGYEETNTRYQKSLQLFQKAKQALDQATSIYESSESNEYATAIYNQQVQAIAEAIGREKIDEMNDWFADQLKRSYTP